MVSILTEGGKSIGFGHIARCCAIYDAFDEVGIKALLVVNSKEKIADYIADRNYIRLNWLKEYGVLVKRVAKDNMVIVDSYLASLNDCERISGDYKKIVYIDDNARLNYPRGIVINPTNYTQYLAFPNNPQVTRIMGKEYILLRKDFWRDGIKKANAEVRHMMLSLGGSDIRNLTAGILQWLVNNFPDAYIHVIYGGQNYKITRLVDQYSQIALYTTIPAAKMKKCMLKMDVAVTGGGQTLYELFKIGVPSVAISMADNQVKSLQDFQEKGLLKDVIHWYDNDLLCKVQKSLTELMEPERRQEISSLAQSYIDGQGARRLVAELIRYEKNYR